MLYKNSSSIENNLKRDVYMDNYFDLFVWYKKSKIAAFQLCYSKGNNEHAITWQDNKLLVHTEVDDGNEPLSFKKTPVLLGEKKIPYEKITEEFLNRSLFLDNKIFTTIMDVLGPKVHINTKDALEKRKKLKKSYNPKKEKEAYY